MTKEEFDDWKRDFRTREFLACITTIQAEAKNAATNPSVLQSPNPHLQHARYVGMVEACDAMLNLEITEDEVTDNHE